MRDHSKRGNWKRTGRALLLVTGLGPFVVGGARAQSSNIELQILQGVNFLRNNATAQQTSLTTVQNALTAQQASLNTLQANVNTLQAALASLQAQVTTLQTLVSNVPQKKYFLTITMHDSSEASTACGAGFHMASLAEIFNPSNLKYDTLRGSRVPDSGSGLTTGQGWVRTGGFSDPSGIIGVGNCSVWSTTEPDVFGTIVGWNPTWNDDPYSFIDPWRAFSAACSEHHPVWCKEN